MSGKNKPSRSWTYEQLKNILQNAADSIEEGIPLSDNLEIFAATVAEVYSSQKELQEQQALRKRAEELEVLSALSLELRQLLTFDETISLLVDMTMSVLGVDTNALLILDEDILAVTAGRNVKDGLVGRRIPVADSPLGTVLQNGESLFVTSETSVPQLRQCKICKDLMAGSAAGAFVRLRTAESPIGLLYVGYATQRSFDTHDKNLFDTVGAMAGNALYRANALDLLEQRVTDRTQKLTALYNVTAAANESLDRSTVLERSLREVLLSSIGDAGAIHLMDDATAVLELAHQQITPAGSAADVTSLLPGHKLADLVFTNEQPIVVSDLHTDPRVDQSAHESGFRSYVGVPMHAGGKVLGVLSIFSRQPQRFSVEEVALTNSIADHIAVAVENARMHQRAQYLAVQEERRRLARELHDSVTQLLYSISMFAGTGRELAKKQAWDEITRLCNRMDETALQALKEMRLLLYELQPSALRDADLEQALHHRLGAIERQVNIKVHLVVEQCLDMSESTAQALYQITNEALNDIVRHSAASEVTVSIFADGEYVVLEVADDGQEFDTAVANTPRGMAVSSIREWAKKAGGTLKVVSAPNEGTIVTIQLKKNHS